MAEVVEVKTIGEVERIVLASGEFDGQAPVEFSNNGMPMSWAEVWEPSEQFPHPVFARTAVHRKNVKLPQTVTIRWDEQVPVADPEWAEKWINSPMRHFGRTARMVAFRQMFRDLLGDTVIEDEADEVADIKSKANPEPAPEPRDFGAEFDAAETVDELDAIVKDARKARVFKPDAEGTALDRHWKARRRALAAETKPAPAAPAEPAAEVKPAKPVPAAKPKPRKRRTRPARPGHSVAENLDADVAAALQQFGSKAKA